MFLILFSNIFFALPIVLVASFILSLCKYYHAKRENKAFPDSFSAEEIERRRRVFIILSVVTAVVLAVFTFILVLFTRELAHM